MSGLSNYIEQFFYNSTLETTELVVSSYITFSNSIVNSTTKTTQTLTNPNVVGTVRTITNKNTGLVKIVASNNGTIDGLSYFPLLQGEYVRLSYTGSNNWKILETTPRVRFKKIINKTTSLIGIFLLDIDGNVWHQPGARFPSTLDGRSVAVNQSIKKIFPKNNPNIKFTEKSVAIGDTLFLHDTDNNLWGGLENEGGQLNQGNQTDVYELKLIDTNVEDFFYPDSPGSNGLEQVNLIVKNFDGHVKFCGPDNNGQSGTNSTAGVRTSFIVLTTEHPNSQLSFTKTVSTTINSSTITITGAGQTTDNLVIGQRLTGTNIPANSTVLSITNSTQFVISNNATATGTNITASFYGWMAPGSLDKAWISDAYTSVYIFWQFNNLRKFATGSNASGPYGNNTTTSSTVPVEITSFWGRITGEPANDGLNWRIEKARLTSTSYDGTTNSTRNYSNLLLRNINTNHTRNQRCGNNTYGVIGNGTTTNVTSPYLVASSISSDITAIFYKGEIVDIGSQGGGVASVFLIFANGTIYPNGYNGLYNLMDGTTTQRNSPFQLLQSDGITSITNAVKVLSDGFNSLVNNWHQTTFVKLSNGKALSGGYNDTGSAGVFNNLDVIRPTEVQIKYDRHGEVLQIAAMGYEGSRKSHAFLTESMCILKTGRNYEYQFHEIAGTAVDSYLSVPTETYMDLV